MKTMIIAGRTNAHLSRQERRGLERADAFLCPTPAGPPDVALGARVFALIERLVGEDHAPLSSALLLVAGKGSR